MDYTVTETRSYGQERAQVHSAALQSISEGLEGTITQQNEEMIEGKFPKTIRGKVLGDRTHIEVKLTVNSDGGTDVAVEIYPLDPVGRKLMFGARKGVSGTVMSWFWAHLEHRLQPAT